VARKHLREPQEVKIRSATSTVATTRQRYWQVRGADKLEGLTRILEVEADFDAAIVFVRTKTATVELAEKLEARGYQAAALNGDMTQGLREQVIERLKTGSLDIVVATDVAARGIDVPRISHVINYDVPYDTEAYVHRIGRTGRAGRTGTAILFVAPREMRMLKVIERATRQIIEPIALPSRSEVAGRRVAQFKEQILEVLEAEKLDFFFEVVRQMEDESALSARQIAAALAYLAQRERPLQPEGSDAPEPVAAAPFQPRPERAPRPETQERFERPERSEHPFRENHDRAPARPRSFADGALARYRIEVGRNQGATPKEIVGAIANEGGIEGRYIGQIHLFDDYSTVELPANLPADLLDVLKRTRVRQQPLRIRPVGAEEGAAQAPRPKWDAKRPAKAPYRSEEPAKPPFRGERKFPPKPFKSGAAGKPKKY
jgi:ATP-dependent RNA helicase DeaD